MHYRYIYAAVLAVNLAAANQADNPLTTTEVSTIPYPTLTKIDVMATLPCKKAADTSSLFFYPGSSFILGCLTVEFGRDGKCRIIPLASIYGVEGRSIWVIGEASCQIFENLDCTNKNWIAPKFSDGVVIQSPGAVWTSFKCWPL